MRTLEAILDLARKSKPKYCMHLLNASGKCARRIHFEACYAKATTNSGPTPDIRAALSGASSTTKFFG